MNSIQYNSVSPEEASVQTAQLDAAFKVAKVLLSATSEDGTFKYQTKGVAEVIDGILVMRKGVEVAVVGDSRGVTLSIGNVSLCLSEAEAMTLRTALYRAAHVEDETLPEPVGPQTLLDGFSSMKAKKPKTEAPA